MATIEFKVKGLSKIVKALEEYPNYSRQIFANAINALLAELHKNAVDDNFQFKTPRMLRTGRLSSSFSEGINLASAYKLEGSIGPKVNYAIFVHEGTRYIKPNPFMERILKASLPKGNQYFQSAIDQIGRRIAVTA